MQQYLVLFCGILLCKRKCFRKAKRARAMSVICLEVHRCRLCGCLRVWILYVLGIRRCRIHWRWHTLEDRGDGGFHPSVQPCNADKQSSLVRFFLPLEIVICRPSLSWGRLYRERSTAFLTPDVACCEMLRIAPLIIVSCYVSDDQHSGAISVMYPRSHNHTLRRRDIYGNSDRMDPWSGVSTSLLF